MRRSTVLAAIPFLFATCLAAERTLVEGIVVRVNERVLTTRDMGRRIAERAGEIGRPLTGEEVQALVREIADDLCLLERASELKVDAEEQDVDAALGRLREQNQVKDEAAFQESLKNMGITLDQLRERVRENIVINRLLSREVPRPQVTEEELKQRFSREESRYQIPERVHIEHLILTVGPDAGDEERVLASARRLAAAARASGDFQALVKSEVDAGRGTGGDLGVVAVPDLRKEVATAVATLKPGEISEPFRTANGVHVVHLVERLAAAVRPFNEVADELRYREEDERYRGHITDIVRDLKKRYIVEIHSELLHLPTQPAP
ncbi:MAG TPA: peptidyl-prolyl cis-trans isomerase [Thermoanaerobaculaceae bacterium]|nr:peptidyl-prolyl cis-trans isomerase [Thermoanaerobaculaceae bacterium]HPS78046.1 peptidyl-prolyl cis-trans isomerase [Thermoanaerobaculaceae bacterium]